MRLTRAEAKAQKIIEGAGLTKPPVDPRKIAEELGAYVTESHDLASSISGLIHRDDGDPVIVVNGAHGELRQRFTVAHELGHMVLHRDPFIVDKMARVHWRDEKSSRATHVEEIEANAFAAELLMPRQFVEKAVRRFLTKSGSATASDLTEHLASKFKVSSQAMGYRLVNLGYLSPEG